MTISMYSDSLTDGHRPLRGAVVEVRVVGTTDKIAETIYATDDVDGATLENPFQIGSDGRVTFFLEQPDRVDIHVTKAGYEPNTFTVDVDAPGVTSLDNHLDDDDDAHPASAISFAPTTSLLETNAQDVIAGFELLPNVEYSGDPANPVENDLRLTRDVDGTIILEFFHQPTGKGNPPPVWVDIWKIDGNGQFTMGPGRMTDLLIPMLDGGNGGVGESLFPALSDHQHPKPLWPQAAGNTGEFVAETIPREWMNAVDLGATPSGGMEATAIWLPKTTEYNAVQLALGPTVPVNLTHYWVAIYSSSGFTLEVQSVDFMFTPNLAGVSPAQNRDVDHSPPDVDAQGGFLELYFDGLFELFEGLHYVAVGGVADTMPHLMGHVAHLGTSNVYNPPLTKKYSDAVTDTAPAGGTELDWHDPGGSHTKRFYAAVEAPSG